MESQYRTVNEINAAVDAAKREGLIKKEDLDWFQSEYKRLHHNECWIKHQDGKLTDRDVCR